MDDVTAAMKGRTTRAGRRRRVVGGAVAVAAVLLPWLAVVVFAGGADPAPVVKIDRLFALALAATYLGGWGIAIAVSRSVREMVMRAAATTLTLGMMVLLLELAALFQWVHWTLVFRQLSGEGVDYQTAYVLDDTLSFRRIPGLHWTGRPASDIEQQYGLPRSLDAPLTFTYDRWGYRNATEMAQADVVLIGDSYVEGWYVSDEQTTASRLADRLGRPVANLGVAGYGTMQTLRVLRHDAARRKPRVVVWFFFEGNDLYDDQVFENALLAAPPSPEEQTPHADGLTRSHGWARRSFVRNAFRRLRRWSHPLIPNRAPYWARLSGSSGASERIYFADYGKIPWSAYEEDRWARARAAFEDGVAFAHASGIDLVLLYVPTKYRVYREFVDVPPGSPMAHWSAWAELPKAFRTFCEEVAVPCLDLTEALQQGVRQGHAVYAPTDTHWSPEGHALVADVLERMLRTSSRLFSATDASTR